MKRFILLLPFLFLFGCSKSNNPSSNEAPPFTVRFEQMIPSRGVMLPKVEIVNQSAKNINTLQFDYRCFDSAGADITITNVSEGHNSWGMTAPDAPANPLLAPKATNETVVGFDKSWVPDGTIRIIATPVWAQFSDGTEWRKN
jgi:hypothetical protein